MRWKGFENTTHCFNRENNKSQLSRGKLAFHIENNYLCRTRDNEKITTNDENSIS